MKSFGNDFFLPLGHGQAPKEKPITNRITPFGKQAKGVTAEFPKASPASQTSSPPQPLFQAPIMTHMYVRMYVCMSVCMDLPSCIHTYTTHMYTNRTRTYTHPHTRTHTQKRLACLTVNRMLMSPVSQDTATELQDQASKSQELRGCTTK